jgi:Tol biopolymer transport system component
MSTVKALFFMGILLGLVFAAGGGSFGRSSAEASAPTLVTRSAAATGSARAAARIGLSSGDGKIAFVRTVGRFMRPAWFELYVMNPDGSGKRRLARHAWLSNLNPGSLAWSPDRRKLVFAAHLSRSAAPCDSYCGKEIFVINGDGSGLRRLTRNTVADWEPAWSPDGRLILFASSRDGGHDLFVMNADGSGQRPLTPKPGTRGDPRWSPDGRAILFTVAPPGQPRSASGFPFGDVYVLNADGSGQRNLTHTRESGEFDAAWSPNGQYIAFSRLAGPPWGVRILVMNADGSGKRAVTPEFARTGDRGITGAWSPDGRRIAFDEDDAIYVVNADGSGLRRLAQNAAFQDWSPDGRKLIFVRLRHPKQRPPATAPGAPFRAGADLWVMNADGSGQRNLTPGNPTADDGSGATWAR